METWVWRVALTGYVLACAVFLDYWTQWTGSYNALFEVGWIGQRARTSVDHGGVDHSRRNPPRASSAPRLQPLLLALAIPWRG